MEKELSRIAMEALKLPTKSRAQLAEKLIYSLDGKDYSSNERLWARESQKRYHELASGKVKGKPASKVLREIRSKLR